MLSSVMTPSERTAARVLAHRRAGIAVPSSVITRHAHPELIESTYASQMLDALNLRELFAPLIAALPSMLDEARRSRGDGWVALVRLDAGETKRARDLMESARSKLDNAIKPSRLEAIAERMGRRTSDAQRASLNKQAKAAIGVDVHTLDRRVPSLVDHFVHQNVGLIQSLGRRAAADVEKMVARAFTEGTRAEDLKQLIYDRIETTEAHAGLIARDQIGTLNAQVGAARNRELGVRQFEWTSVGDERVRPEHVILDGQVFSYDALPSEGLPGTPIACRCGATPVFADILNILEGNETPPSDLSNAERGELNRKAMDERREKSKGERAERAREARAERASEATAPAPRQPTIADIRTAMEQAGVTSMNTPPPAPVPATVSRAAREVPKHSVDTMPREKFAKLELTPGNSSPYVSEWQRVPSFDSEMQKTIRQGQNESIARYGMHDATTRKPSRNVVEVRQQDRMLDALGYHEPASGKLILREDMAKDYAHASTDVANGANYGREQKELMLKGNARSAEDNRRLAEIDARTQAFHAVTHETIHGHGPRFEYEREGKFVEEVMTDSAARRVTNESLGFDKGSAVSVEGRGGSYSNWINGASDSIDAEMSKLTGGSTESTRERSGRMLGDAAIRYKSHDVNPYETTKGKVEASPRAALELMVESLDVRGEAEKLGKKLSDDDVKNIKANIMIRFTSAARMNP